jgi:NADH:ubiquinone oxidoreductase subunit K
MNPTPGFFLIVSARFLHRPARRRLVVGSDFHSHGIEMMLAAAVDFIAFWRLSAPPTGVMVAIFAIAAAEAAVGLALVLVVYRHFRTTNVDQVDQLKG